jgi:hypothetical protein
MSYQAAVRKTLDRIAQRPHPPSALVWASLWLPAQYDYFVSTAPNLIHELWTNGVPLDEFQLILDAMVETHNEICTKFEQYKAAV